MAKIKKCCAAKDPARLNKVGGQAVLEGVMMKAGERTVTTCRKEDGSLVVNDASFVSVRKKHKILNIPILRGVINFVEMMMLSFKTLGASADALGIEEEEGKAEKWLKKHLGVGLVDVIMVVAMILGVALALFLFMFLPGLVSDLIAYLAGGSIHPSWRAVIEGVAKILIFLAYLWLVALIPDIKRTFMYHGAEHKSIACFESGAELTPENAKNYTRFHPRCGTSFMFVMIAIGVFVGMLLNNIFPGLNRFALTGIRLLLLPLVVGLGFEFIMFAGKHDNFVTRALSAPGLWVQRITTKEPTLDMLEVAITSIKCALRDDFPEFREFYENRAWEPKKEEPETPEADLSDEALAEQSSASASDTDPLISDILSTLDSINGDAPNEEPTDKKTVENEPNSAEKEGEDTE